MQSAAPIVDRLRREILDPLKARFVGRDEVVDLIALAVVSGEHLFLHGPPGTAKSALIHHFARAVHGRYFEYMLTRFSEPNEIFGPVDIVRLREGVVATVTAGMLPEAEFVFLDELFNANSAILNNLLTVLNERIYRRGAETHQLPLVSLFSAANHLPEDETLQALFDRFLLRCHVDNLKRDSMPRLLSAGWALERYASGDVSISADDLRLLSSRVYEIDLTPVTEAYIDVVCKIRDLGIAYSDRRVVKVLKLLAASALLCNRTAANPSDLWVLRYIWDREEQIAPLRSLVNGVLEQHADAPKRHALASVIRESDGEEIAQALDAVERELEGDKPTLSVVARVRDRVAELADQAAWVKDEKSRNFLLKRTREIVERLG